MGPFMNDLDLDLIELDYKKPKRKRRRCAICEAQPASPGLLICEPCNAAVIAAYESHKREETWEADYYARIVFPVVKRQPKRAETIYSWKKT